MNSTFCTFWLFSVLVNWWIFTSPLHSLVNIHHYSPPLWWVIVKYNKVLMITNNIEDLPTVTHASLMPVDPKYQFHAYRPISHAWLTNLDFLLLKRINFKFNSNLAKTNPENEQYYLCLSQFHTHQQRLKVVRTSLVLFSNAWKSCT